MPLYEFECRGCDGRFEVLIRDSTVPVCPRCGASDVERTLSTFAVGAGGGGAAEAAAACGRCGDPRGAGACGLD